MLILNDLFSLKTFLPLLDGFLEIIRMYVHVSVFIGFNKIDSYFL